MNCRDFRDLIVEALYDELGEDDQTRFDAHLGACEACARLHSEMRATVHTMDKRERSDPGQAFWDGYWNRLTSRMEDEDATIRSGSWLGRFFPQLSVPALRWVYRGALAALLIVFGAVTGRMLLPERESRVATGTDNVATPPAEDPTGRADAQTTRTASAEVCARQYIEDAQVLLLALVNFEPAVEGEYLADWSAEKGRSRELIAQAASLKGDLTDPRQRRLRELVTELEVILLQIAHLETTGDLESVELIRSSVTDRDVMLKINLEKLRAGDMATPAPGACDA